MHTRLGFAMRGQWQRTQTALLQRFGRQKYRPEQFETVPIAVTIPQLASQFEQLRLVQISDIHMGHWITGERLAGLVTLVNALKPDVIAITGDFVSYVLDGVLEELERELSRLQASEVVLAVMGNHDHWLDVGRVRGMLQRSGIVELNNDVYTVKRGEAPLHFAGVDDIYVGAHDLEAVLAKLPAAGPAILLAHEPDFAETSAATGRFALQLSGHSHGGQVVLPKVGPVRGPLFKKYPNGRYLVNHMVQYTNRGVGTHTIRLRINCKPEITDFTLHSTQVLDDASLSH